jgi:hypothetical protein
MEREHLGLMVGGIAFHSSWLNAYYTLVRSSQGVSPVESYWCWWFDWGLSDLPNRPRSCLSDFLPLCAYRCGFWVLGSVLVFVCGRSVGLEKIVHSGLLDGQFFLLHGVREIYMHVVPWIFL